MLDEYMEGNTHRMDATLFCDIKKHAAGHWHYVYTGGGYGYLREWTRYYMHGVPAPTTTPMIGKESA